MFSIRINKYNLHHHQHLHRHFVVLLMCAVKLLRYDTVHGHFTEESINDRVDLCVRVCLCIHMCDVVYLVG